MTPSILGQFLFVLVMAIVIIALCRRLKFPPIIGYMIVGLTINMMGHHHFKHVNELSVLANYGVVFLLFSIGLEFSLPHLMRMKKTVFGLGSLQMLICGLTAYVIARQLHSNFASAFVIAVAIAMSSTAIISKILKENSETTSTVGRLTMSILIFQDLMVVPAIIITGFFTETASGDIVHSLAVELIKGIVTFAVLVLVGKKILTPIFNEMARARSSELFTLTTLCIVLGAAYFSNLMGMSHEFGAFLAGAMIGGTPYHHQVESDIRPFRDVLLGLFFIGVGSLINVDVLLLHAGLILSIAAGIFVCKFFLISYLVRLLQLGTPFESSKTGLLLAQAGEFGFVLITSALHYQFIEHLSAQILLMSMVLSMVISMLALRFQHKFLSRTSQILFSLKKEPPPKQEHLEIKKGSIVIIGFARMGQWIAKALTTQGHQYLALDIDPGIVTQARLAGEDVIFADASDPHILRTLSLENAHAVVLTLYDSTLAFKIIEQVRLCAPNVAILARTHDDKDIEKLLAAGANEVIPDVLEASLMVSLHLLVHLGMDLTEAVRWGDALRRDRYTVLKGYFSGENQSDIHNLEEVREQQKAIQILKGQFADGKTLHQLDIAQYGITILAIRKNGIVGPKPAAQAKIHAGDVLIVSGHIDNIDRFEWHLTEGQ